MVHGIHNKSLFPSYRNELACLTVVGPEQLDL